MSDLFRTLLILLVSPNILFQSLPSIQSSAQPATANTSALSTIYTNMKNPSTKSDKLSCNYSSKNRQSTSFNKPIKTSNKNMCFTSSHSITDFFSQPNSFKIKLKLHQFYLTLSNPINSDTFPRAQIQTEKKLEAQAPNFFNHILKVLIKTS